ncbi:hypothetical protein [Demequina iriomotensis]|uniref:hypothetical protein n=1 Tax=Demequina iriomotensis TaxID=1536641 RepID=UPI000783DD00|nr:hypothetical protein [Demequina iriomotensis]
MRRDGGAGADAGSATVEFVAVTLVLLVPLLALVVAVTRVQAGAYAAEAAATAAARAAVVAGLAAVDGGTDDAAALARAQQDGSIAAALVAEDFGLADPPTVELRCDGVCLAPDTVVTARVAVRVPLPGVPAFVRAAVPAHVTVEALASSPVDGYTP